jgi:hypothetical protein
VCADGECVGAAGFVCEGVLKGLKRVHYKGWVQVVATLCNFELYEIIVQLELESTNNFSILMPSYNLTNNEQHTII